MANLRGCPHGGCEDHHCQLAEATAKDTEDLLRLASDQALIGQVIICPWGFFIRVNDTFCEMTGRTREELIGHKTVEFTHPEDIPASEQFLQGAVGGKPRMIRFDKRYIHKDGSTVWADVSSTLIQSESGEPRCFVSQVLDISARKIAEEKLHASETHLEAMVLARTKQLQDSNEALQSFAYAASHDLREPLHKIQAFGQRLDDKCGDILPEKGKMYLGIMRTAADRMLQLIDDILAYSKSGLENTPVTEVDLKTVMDEVLADMSLTIQEANAKITVEHMPKVRAHHIGMRQVMQNLLSNAVKFRKEGRDPKIHVEGWKEGNYGVVVVKDNGIGFDSLYAEKIFTLFTRLHSRFEYPGTGIGLAMCRRILEQYHGYLTAAGVPDMGATFTVKIPLWVKNAPPKCDNELSGGETK